VHVEVLSWVNRFVGGPGTGEVTVSEAVPRGSSVRAVLRTVSERFPELGRALWDSTRPRELGDNIEVLVSNAVLGVTHDLDSEVLDGERITLLGQYMGGAGVGTMTCPKCQVPLAAARLLEVDVDQCPRCAGIWLDEPELAQVEDTAFDVDEWKGTLAFATSPTSLACPRCGSSMQRFQYRSFDLELECCARLHGYWLDAGEEQRILKLMRKTKADALRKLDAEARWLRFRRDLGSSGFLGTLRRLFRG
jgi:Zn-finger nucleic acid-binding protein